MPGRGSGSGARETPESRSAATETLEALKEFQQELELSPTSAKVAHEAGEIYREFTQPDAARAYSEMALKNYPNFEEAQVGPRRVLIALGKPGLALPHLQKAIALNPEKQVSWYRLLQAERVPGNVPEQQKAPRELQRLQAQGGSRQQAARELFSPQEVTKQKLDPDASP